MLELTERLDARRRRILFRAWNRGMREMDLLIGRFCNSHLAELSEEDVEDLEVLMHEPDPLVLSWLLREAKAPKRFDTPVFRRLVDFRATVPSARI